MFLACVVFKDNRDNRYNYFLAYFKQIFSVRKLKIVSIVSIVFKNNRKKKRKNEERITKQRLIVLIRTARKPINWVLFMSHKEKRIIIKY